MQSKIHPIIFLLISFTFLSSFIYAGNGLPGIRNYSRADYGASTQNWSFAQSKNGLIYFANNNGLLEFEGKDWQLLELTPSFIHRSTLTKNNHVFIGGLNEFGYYQSDSTGNLAYHSLVPKLPAGYNDFGEVWKIHDTSFGIVFQTFQHLFIYEGDSVSVIEPRSRFHFSYYVNGILWVYDEVEGLMQIRDGKLRKAPNGDFFSGTEIWSVLPYDDDQIIIGMVKKGLFLYDGVAVKKWDVQASDFLKKHQLFCSTKVLENTYAFGSIRNGVILVNQKGEILQHINKVKGLQNNTVLSIGTDREGGLWVGLDNGISRISINSPISYIENYFDIGAGYASVKYQNALYLGTNQGVYRIDWDEFNNPLKTNQSFKLIKGSEGQTWNLTKVGNDLLCGHNNGVYIIQNDACQSISSISGAWTFLPLSEDENKLLVGHYNGISILQKKSENWQYQGELKGFDISSRSLEKDKFGNIWMAHGSKGIFKFRLNAKQDSITDIVLFNHKNGLPSVHNNTLFKIEEEIFFATEDGFYRFDYKLSKPVKDEKFNQLFSRPEDTYFIKKDAGNNIWYYSDSQPGVLRYQEDGSYNDISTPFKVLQNRSIVTFEHISIPDEKQIILGTENGFALYQPQYSKDYKQNFPAFIRDIQFEDPALPHYQTNSLTPADSIQIPKVRYRYNTVQLNFAASSFEDKKLLFSYKLSGYDDEWSVWSEKSFKEYTNLHEGTYRILVKAKNIFDTESEMASFKFEILPPFLRSKIAYVIYILLFLFIIAMGSRINRKHIEKSRLKEKEKQKELFREKEHQLKEEALVAEKEVVKMRNDKLRSDMIFKEKELANSTMHVIEKNNFLTKIKAELRKISNETGEKGVKSRIASIMRKIDKDIDNEKQWEIFEMHLDQVHQDFTKRIKERFPDLSPGSLNCALI